MPRRRGEATAAGLLGTWTDSDTAMQIVGTTLGLFGAGLLEPTVALSDETPLRNALFDVLLSLVEGGALEMRPTDDGRYAFRWRADYAVAGLSPATSKTIDLDVPSPYISELAQMRRERDDALGRADFAEALAAERERLLRLASVPVPAQSEPAAKKPAARKPAARKPAPKKPTAKKPAAKKPAARARAAQATDPDESGPGSSGVVYLAPPAPTEPGETRDEQPHRPRWSGYTLDKPRPHLSSVEPLAGEA